MTVFICKGCGEQTNSVCSKFNRGNPPEECYARYVNDKWIKGCGFDNALDFDKAFAMSLITKKDIMCFLEKRSDKEKYKKI